MKELKGFDKMKFTFLKAAWLSVVVCLLSLTVSAQGLTRRPLGNRLARPTAAPTSSSSSASSSGEVPALNWDAAPVDIVLQAYGERVGKTILKDPQVPQATITLKSQPGQKLTNEEYLEAIETVLEMNQIHLEPYGESFIRALPRKDVRKEGIPLIMDPEAQLKESGKVVSMMIQFKNIGTEEAQKALEGLKSNSGILLVFERTNSILVTDTEQNINRMLEIARTIDVASPVTEVVEYIQIKYASATEVKQVIDSIVQESMKEQEKNGKQPQNTPAQPTMPRPLLGGLRRPGQQQPQNNAPVNQASLVMTVSDADRGMIRGKVVTIADERSNKILIITNASNMKFFKEVIAALDVETTPDTVVKVYRLKYAEAEDVSDMINDLIGNSSSSKSSGKSNQNQAAKSGTSGSVTRGNTTQARKPANQRSGDVKAGELNKENTTVLADKRINGLVVMTQKELVPTIEQIIESMDIKLSQVLIETVIIEVGLGDDVATGIDWVNNHTTGKDPENLVGGGGGSNSELLKSMKGTVKKYSEYLTDAKAILGDESSTYGSTSYSEKQKAIEALAESLRKADETNLGTVSPVGTGINYFLKSDKLNLSAIITASKTDSHSKYIASPIIMTLDNKEAQIEATEMRYLFKGYTYSGSTYNGSAVPDYEQKELGITIKTTPKINPNGTVMLTIEEEYSQEGSGQAITAANGTDKINAATTITRKMSADALLEDGQTVVFGGLTETKTGEKSGGIPILKDIPLIGKWLFGYVEESESRKELLVFMTPYVLNDAAVAQAEALRRKKAISDPAAWDDHGWSASVLADPVSKKEQMRRIKEEWRKQDEERKSKLAIEKMKVERAKKLQEMSVEERARWLMMHKEELDKEAQEKLEEKMLDKDSQDMLRKLAAEVRKQKLAAAETEIKAAADETAAENERGKLDAEKKAKAE